MGEIKLLPELRSEGGRGMSCEYCTNNKTLPLMKDNAECIAYMAGNRLMFKDGRFYDWNGIPANYCIRCGSKLGDPDD